MSGITKIVPGDQVPLVLLLDDGATGFYPQAAIYDGDGNPLTTLDLAHVADGRYAPTGSYNMPEANFITAVYIVYGDALHTGIAPSRSRDMDTFVNEGLVTGTLTTELSNLIEELHYVQGLGGLEWPGTGTPLEISGTQRRVLGQLTQKVEADTPVTGTVRVTRTG